MGNKAKTSQTGEVITVAPQRPAAKRVKLTGVVQGVGFRPFVYNLALEHGLHGWVRNTSAGVEIEIEGATPAVRAFVNGLTAKAPPLACIESISVADVEPNGYEEFVILRSQPQAGAYQLVSPDIATCADCLRELFDPQDRRHGYPFINCTNCGPRFTIIEDIPYDRPKTTMRQFPMCADCHHEYEDPTDRRFHAQPNACPVCGPHLCLVSSAQPQATLRGDKEVISQASTLLKQGAIIAVKGLGGFQFRYLSCGKIADNGD